MGLGVAVVPPSGHTDPTLLQLTWAKRKRLCKMEESWDWKGGAQSDIKSIPELKQVFWPCALQREELLGREGADQQSFKVF